MTRERCYLCLRIDRKEYYAELRQLGFNSFQAQQALKLVEETYLAFPHILCGHTAKGIKGACAYIFGLVFCEWNGKALFSQERIANHWETSSVTVRKVYKIIVKAWATKWCLKSTSYVPKVLWKRLRL